MGLESGSAAGGDLAGGQPTEQDPSALELLELGDALLVLDADWRIVRVNATQERLSQRSRGETLGRLLWEVWPELSNPESPYGRAYRRCMEQRVSVRFEAHFAPLDLWTHVTAHPTRTGGIAVFFRDAGAELRASEELRRSEERFRTLADAMPQLVWTAKPDGTVDYYNCRSRELAGIDRQPDGSYRWAPVLHPEDMERTLVAWGRAVSTGETYEIEHRVQRRDGPFRWYLSRGEAARDERGRIVKWYGTATDIHEQKLALQALEEADRRKNEFLSMLSHELRNPIAPIHNALFVLAHSDPAGPEAQRAREIAVRQIAHLTHLVDDLLDVTRIARGKIRLRRWALDLSELVQRACEDHRPMMQERGLELILAPSPSPTVVHADPTRLVQLVGNLLQNATKFTSTGGRVSVTVRRSHGRAEIEVRDTGIGIEPEFLGRVFDPFVQAEHSLARTQGGLGLGLALVKAIAELHGGTAAAASGGIGRGSTFTVVLPLAPGPRASGPRPPPARRTQRRRVLVVEDNPDVAEMLAQVVVMFGHEVEVAHDGPSAVDRARASRPDVVLCDIGLPGMSGYEVAQALRAGDGGPPLLVAISGYAQPEDVELAVRSGFDVHLAKPTDPDALERLLARSPMVHQDGTGRFQGDPERPNRGVEQDQPRGPESFP